MTNERRLAHRPVGVLDTLAADGGYLSLDELEKVVPPDNFARRLALQHGESDAVKDGKANPGEWYARNVFTSGRASVVVVVKRGKLTRSLPPVIDGRRKSWIDGDFFENCSSTDGRGLVGKGNPFEEDGVGYPSGDGGEPKTFECANCEFSKWTEQTLRGGKVINVKPQCVETLTFLVEEESTGELMEVDFRVGGFNAGKRLLSVGGNERRVELSAERVEYSDGEYWRPVVRVAPDAPPQVVVESRAREVPPPPSDDEDDADGLPW